MPASALDVLMERDLLPDAVIRLGIRRICRQRLRDEAAGDPAARMDSFLQQMASSPIALNTDAANQQHYEVPAAFYTHVLGPRLKYSCGLWLNGTRTLAAAEEAMLDVTAQRAELADGQRILELGCGWGSLTRWMSERFPNAHITAVSNSSSQKQFIDSLGLGNVTVITADMNDFSPSEKFDRVVSVEMFEHMRNHARLLERISTWLTPQGRLFVHIFVHRTFAYPYEVKDDSDWMARHFFTGGMMPSEGMFLRLQQHMRVVQQWRVDGTHYQKTSNAWLRNMDAHPNVIRPLFKQTYGAQAARFWSYWRVFFMACAELFGLDNGTQWFVGHYLLAPC